MFQNFETGWCVGKSSPMWSNTENITNLIKGYEYTKNVTDLTKYPLVGSMHITLNSGYIVIDDVPLNTPAGIDYNASESMKITVDPTQDYEISFRVKQEALLSIISFGLRAYDKDGNLLTLESHTDGTNSNYFFQNLVLKKVDTEYLVRAILWNKNKTNGTIVPNIGTGNTLKSISTICKIVPIITVEDTSDITTKTYLRDIKVRPLKLNFSRGQLGVHNILYLLFKNNNGELNLSQIKDFISSKLISYNTFLKVKSI